MLRAVKGGALRTNSCFELLRSPRQRGAEQSCGRRPARGSGAPQRPRCRMQPRSRSCAAQGAAGPARGASRRARGLQCFPAARGWRCNEIFGFPASPCSPGSLEHRGFMSRSCSREFVQVVSFARQMLLPQECPLGLRKGIVCSHSCAGSAFGFPAAVAVKPSQSQCCHSGSTASSCRHRLTEGWELTPFPPSLCWQCAVHGLWFPFACVGSKNCASTVLLPGRAESKGVKNEGGK